jgi:hypothetical protein
LDLVDSLKRLNVDLLEALLYWLVGKEELSLFIDSLFNLVFKVVAFVDKIAKTTQSIRSLAF